MSERDDPRVTPAAMAMIDAQHRIYSERIRAMLDAADAADRENGIVRVDTRDEATVEKVTDHIMAHAGMSEVTAFSLAKSVLAALAEQEGK